MTPPIPAISARALALFETALKRPGAPDAAPERLFVVDVERQTGTLVEDGAAVASWPVSTARNGIGGEENSFKTPPGWHRIDRKIGAGAGPGTVFESREPTGRTWLGEPCSEDLIVTRILTLDGLEDGVNRGPGCDSLQRYVYIHGTNHEDLIGTPASCGCVRMRNADVTAFFDRAREGDIVLIAPSGTSAVPDLASGRFHYAGLGGSGMSAIAQFQAMKGGRVSGSDRAFDHGERGAVRARFEALGIGVYPQDGSGIGEDCAALVVSTAVEETVPDVATAKARGVPIVHRSEMLAHFVGAYRSIAVTGTSGKSTVTGMTFEILRGMGADPSVITGGDLPALQAEGLIGNAYAGASGLLVVEADESDGSLVRYAPSIGVILNLQRDHKEMDEVAAMFATLRARTRERLVVGDDENLDPFAGGAIRFGLSERADIRGREVEHSAAGARFKVDDVAFEIPVPGLHNVTNALAAIAACRAVGLPLEGMAKPLSGFSGIGRRFQTVARARGIEVVDDFAHNAEKIAAAIRTAKLRGRRVMAIYQPHGYGPTRFLWQDFVRTFSNELSPQDRLYMLEVFYAGGTATRDFSSADIVAEIAGTGTNASFAPSRPWLIETIANDAREGDVVLVMGARDPSLTAFAREIAGTLART
ncbi:L,D-transpeptidase family protein [Methyloceanibacter sp.]|uniref:glutamate ligase domain-containing protein n=1 Tax=Methyloceanibacter sp. TaxID=1965321 RepID=UPI002C578E1E|nr:L,D-transpeptidase family protein [Methyloceanibacter sp.]HML91538.1 Mur ligase family protein [Methyloceanibacter sp.]